MDRCQNFSYLASVKSFDPQAGGNKWASRQIGDKKNSCEANRQVFATGTDALEGFFTKIDNHKTYHHHDRWSIEDARTGGGCDGTSCDRSCARWGPFLQDRATTGPLPLRQDIIAPYLRNF
jgi:hypothetical protein